MENNEKTIDVLNDLVRINNDRIKGYQKAIEDSKGGDHDYDGLFRQMINQSENYKTQLINEIKSLSGKADYESNTTSGKIYHAWMDVKSAFQGKTDKSALELSEYGEDAAQKAYKDALETDGLPSSVRQLIQNQKMKLKESHDTIKMERDKEKAIS